jgi:hypothetical protein
MLFQKQNLKIIITGLQCFAFPVRQYHNLPQLINAMSS